MTPIPRSMAAQPPPDWCLPTGVDAPLWAYAHSERLALEDDGYFAGHPLLNADLDYVLSRLRPPGVVADLGCGTGRAALALAARGFEILAVDLSPAMLRHLAAQARRNQLPILAIRGNLCDLRTIRSESCDAALLLFSTLGMIRGRAARRRALAQAAQIVKPSGRLILHAHNLWHNLRQPGGRSWLASQWLMLALDPDRAGDRPMTYRGIPNLIVHQYRYRELRADLLASGWTIVDQTALDAVTARPIRWPGLLPSLRAGGWLVTAQRTARIKSLA
ncbi:MAG: SAM-dependent methyltransferase [Isosphaeraceae bacterium]|nr:MAG: SAM-dependent methyltransferase [Isosphaeraceae bacterium]